MNQISSSKVIFRDIAERIAIFLLLFSLTLAGALFASGKFLLPKLSQIEIGGVERNALQLEGHIGAIEKEIEVLEEKRNQLVTPLRDSIYGAIREAKYSLPDCGKKLGQVFQAGEMVAVKSRDTAHLQVMKCNPSEQKIDLDGDIRNVGPRSMTILGRYLDILKGFEGMSVASLPKFTRKSAEGIGQFSPFSIDLRLE